MSRQPHETPSLEPASRGARLAAACLDTLLLSVGLGIVAIPLLFSPTDGIPSEAAKFRLGIAFAIVGAVWLLANAVLLFRYGQTIGKRLLRIRVVGRDGTPAGLRTLASRLLPLLLLASATTMGSAAALMDVLFIFGNAQRCLHDYIGGTVVVRIRSR